MKNIIYKIFTIGFFILFYLCVTARISWRDVNLPNNKYTQAECTQAYRILYDELDDTLPKISNKEYKSKVNVKKHFYLEANTHESYGLPQLNLIIMRKDLSGWKYCVDLSHEKTHIVMYSSNETAVCFQNFVSLYTSSDPYLKQAGVKYGLQQLNDLYFDEYDIKGQIINYLLNKEIYVTIN